MVSKITVWDALLFTRVRLFHVYPVLHDIEIEGGEVDGAKVVDAVVDGVEGIALVRLLHPYDQPLEPGEQPLVEIRKILVCHAVLRGIEVVMDIGMEEP